MVADNHCLGCVTPHVHVSRWQEIERVVVSGGNLDHDSGLDILREKGGHELHIALKNEAGQVYRTR